MAITDFLEETEEIKNHFHDDEPISIEDFEQTYDHLEDEFTYEWVDGRTMKTIKEMNSEQFLIQSNLIDFLAKIKAKNPKIKGQLISEGDNFFNGNRRRPDMAYYTNEQLKASFNGEKTVPEFVIEIASRWDTWHYYMSKREDYLKAGVKVFWVISPLHKNVVIYKKDNSIQHLQDADLCSAASVIDGFSISVDDLFKMIE